ncbi:MAG: hypothetical protein HYY61_01735 [Deltaproteobacteria bacterium]|nr:hypothetical protein [Deltaproteobacteria bacterium]
MESIQVSFKEVLKKALNFFEEHGIHYVLFGAWAVNYWGQPRSTQDFDFLVLLSEEDFEKLKQKLKNLSSFQMDLEWHKHNPMITKRHARFTCHNVIVDITLPRDEHDEAVLKRRIKRDMSGIPLYVLTPEDSILQKLKTGRPKDFDDALSVFIKQKENIDFNYLRSWAKKLGIYEELNWLFTKVK